MRFIRFVIGITWLMAASQGFAQTSDERTQLIDSFLLYRKSSTSIYLPPPVTHMVPNFNTITYALAYEKRDITLFPKYDNGAVVKNNPSTLHMTGYTVAPHLAISLKKVGIGFSIENSKNSASTLLGNNFNSASNSFQDTTVSASGLGFNLSALPFESFRKDNKLAFILGGKSLNVRHEFSSLTNSQFQGTVEPLSLRYNLLRYEAGANLTLALLKHFDVILWTDYSYTDLSAAKAAYQPQFANPTQLAIYNDDLRLFWQSNPNLRYGIDLSINAWGFDIRIGSLLGSLARLGAGPDYVKDSSFNISLSFDQKGS
ncbi:MAG: hypothetical protein H7318_08445 [Oligoflexus sp.]|nr:hypothetical protein [Oligoflexus sp.]